MNDRLSKRKIKKLLCDNKFDIKVLKSVNSTNTYLKQSALKGAAEGTVVIADSQTDGTGRFNRKFYSPKGTGIYMSILAKPSIPADKGVTITAAAAVAVAKAVEKLSQREVQIKWVNDLLIDKKKFCGILTSGSVNQKGYFDWVIIGIGINIYRPTKDFSSEIKDIATYVFDKKERNLRNRLSAEIITAFFEILSSYEEKAFLDDYKKRSIAVNKEIEVLKNGKSLNAVALSIDDNCRLLVKYPDGEEEYLSSGEISIKLQ